MASSGANTRIFRINLQFLMDILTTGSKSAYQVTTNPMPADADLVRVVRFDQSVYPPDMYLEIASDTYDNNAAGFVVPGTSSAGSVGDPTA